MGVNTLSRCYKPLDTIILVATKLGNLKVVELLLTEGSPVYSVQCNKISCLTVAVEHNYVDIVKLLLNYKTSWDFHCCK